MNWPEFMEQTAQRYADLAQEPGWFQYVKQTIIDMEAMSNGHCWPGLRKRWGAILKQAGYVVPVCEKESIWIQPDPLPVPSAPSPPPTPRPEVSNAWREHDYAYQAHTQTCGICIAAGKGNGDRCADGSALWGAYSRAAESVAWGRVRRAPTNTR